MLNIIHYSLIGNKLSDRHINYRENVQRASLAIQTLSNSVADVMTMQEEHYKNPMFKGCAGTALFCTMMNNAYEILNVRSLFGDWL